MTAATAFLLCAILSGIWCVVHVFVGERDIARPLRLDRTLDPVVRETAFLCWHMVSVALALMSGFFVAAIFGSSDFAWAGVLLAMGFAITGLILPRTIGAPYARLPQGFLFIPVVALGLWGIWM